MVRIGLLLAAIITLAAVGCAAGPAAAPRPKTASFAIRTAVYYPKAGYRKVLNPQGESDEWRVIWVSPKVELDETDVADATVVHVPGDAGDTARTEPAVAISMTREGSKKLKALTSDYVSYSRLALFVDNRMVMSPRVARAIMDGKMLLRGEMSEAEAERIAAALSGRRRGAQFVVP